MEYIRVTKDNIETEHICCALSNNNDIQVCSKKEWMKSCFDDGLVFIKSEKGVNVSLNTYQLKMRGFQLKPMSICILIVFGFQEH